MISILSSIKCFGSNLLNRTLPIAGLINASTALLYVANVEGRRRGLTISSSHLSSQSFKYGAVRLGIRPERSYSSFLSFNRFNAMALVRPRASRRRRFPVVESGGSSHVARYPPVYSGLSAAAPAASQRLPLTYTACIPHMHRSSALTTVTSQSRRSHRQSAITLQWSRQRKEFPWNSPL